MGYLKQLLAIAVLALISASAAAHAGPPFVSVAPEPANHAWYLRAQYHPFGKTVAGVPIKKIDASWCAANAFTDELLADTLAEFGDLEGFHQYGLTFTTTGRFIPGKRPVTATVGAYETCTGEKGIFLLVVDPKNKKRPVHYLLQRPGHETFAALKKTRTGPIVLWWCMSCDHFDSFSCDRATCRPDPPPANEDPDAI